MSSTRRRATASRRGPLGAARAPASYSRDQLRDRARPAGAAVRARRGLVVPGVEDLQEDPLRPAHVARVDRRERAPRVVAQAEAAQLALHDRDVRLGAWCAGAHPSAPRTARRAARTRRTPARAARCRPASGGTGRRRPCAMYPSGCPMCRPAPEGYGNMSMTKNAGCAGSALRPSPSVRSPDRVGGEERAALLPLVLPAQLDLARERRPCSGTGRRRWSGGGGVGGVLRGHPCEFTEGDVAHLASRARVRRPPPPYAPDMSDSTPASAPSSSAADLAALRAAAAQAAADAAEAKAQAAAAALAAAEAARAAGPRRRRARPGRPPPLSPHAAEIRRRLHVPRPDAHRSARWSRTTSRSPAPPSASRSP